MTALEMERKLLEQWHTLPPGKRMAALDFIRFLNADAPATQEPRQSALGLCADLAISPSAEEIDFLRRELWSSFPREDF